MLLFLGVSLPLFSVEKWLFWNKEYFPDHGIAANARGARVAAADGGRGVCCAVAVVPFPEPDGHAPDPRATPPPALVKVAFGLEKRTMWEVYALALIVVAIKLGDFAELQFRPCFWLIVCMVPLSLFDGWLFRRRLQWTTDSA